MLTLINTYTYCRTDHQRRSNIVQKMWFYSLYDEYNQPSKKMKTI